LSGPFHGPPSRRPLRPRAAGGTSPRLPARAARPALPAHRHRPRKRFDRRCDIQPIFGHSRGLARPFGTHRFDQIFRRDIFGQNMHVEHAKPFASAMDQQRRRHHPREAPSLKFVEHRNRIFARRTIMAIADRMDRADRRPARAIAAQRAPCDMIVSIHIGEAVHHRIGQRRRRREKPQIPRFGRQLGDSLADALLIIGTDCAQAHRRAVVERAMHRNIVEPR
jgi:hypothetical protein